MKKSVLLGTVVGAAAIGAAAVYWGWDLFQGTAEIKEHSAHTASDKSASRIIRGTGYVRGVSTRSLKNKYASYVSKVNFYSHFH